jgi:hypothetical protein
MRYLNNMTIYLAGPIDNFEGEDWRAKYLPDFKKLGLKVYSPMIKPDWISPDARVKKLSDETVENMKDGLYQGAVSQASKEVREVCLSMVSHSGIVLCYLPKIFTVGTFDEIFTADRQNKPIIFVFENEAIISLYAADLFYRHVITNSFKGALKCLDGINEFGYKYFENNGLNSLEDRCRWLPITHKAL